MRLEKGNYIDENYEYVDTNYIENHSFNIIKNNQHIGTVIGSRLNIPLLLNDILTSDKSLIELDSISGLHSRLWFYLFNKIELLEKKSGYLYFFNRMQFDKGYFCYHNEKDVLLLLQDEMNIIIYSCHSSKEFGNFNSHIHLSDQAYWGRKKDLLLNLDWIEEENYGFFLYATRTNDFAPYKVKPTATIVETPFEYWVKSKGTVWLESMWEGIMQQPCYSKQINELKMIHNDNQEAPFISPLVAECFSKEIKVIDFEQLEPEISYFETNHKVDNEISRNESLVVDYRGEKYGIFFSQNFTDNNNKDFENFLDVGFYNKELKMFEIGDDINEVCASVEIWLQEAFIELFNRLYNQYRIEINSKINNSIFMAALNKPTLIERDIVKQK